MAINCIASFDNVNTVISKLTSDVEYTGTIANQFSGAFFQFELLFLVHHLDKLIYRWVIRKYKKQGSNFKKADNWVKRIKSAKPNYFVHWSLLRA